jgi:segregation and condensation protein B
MQNEISQNSESPVADVQEETASSSVPEQLEIETVSQEVRKNAKGIIESVLFASSEPVSFSQLHDILKEGFTQKEIREILNQMKEEYLQGERGIELFELNEGLQLKTRPQFAPWIRKIIKVQHKERFSKSALETLAIIAYKQPISRAEIEEIRGVNVDGVMRVLLEKGLIHVSGKKDIPGKPWLYSTTKEFLIHFGLKSLQELPPLNELTLNIN